MAETVEFAMTGGAGLGRRSAAKVFTIGRGEVLAAIVGRGLFGEHLVPIRVAASRQRLRDTTVQLGGRRVMATGSLVRGGGVGTAAGGRGVIHHSGRGGDG